MKNVGVNLYSLRTLISDERGLTDTLCTLSEIGYNCAQFSGAAFDAPMIKRASEASGVPIILTHVPLVEIVERPMELMEAHATFGCKYIGLGALPHDVLLDYEKFKGVAEKLERSAELMKKNGFALFFHNHHTDCYQHCGVRVLDYLIDKCPSLNFTLDTYWLQYGGLSVTDYIKKLSGRIACVHLKDLKIISRVSEEGKTSFAPIYAPVGEGNLDFGSYYPLMKAAGVEYYLVEQDNAVSFPDPIDEVRRSYNYIRRNFV